jgi:hypothetical protein
MFGTGAARWADLGILAVPVAHITPHAWANDAFTKLIGRGATIGAILPQLGVLADTPRCCWLSLHGDCERSWSRRPRGQIENRRVHGPANERRKPIIGYRKPSMSSDEP